MTTFNVNNSYLCYDNEIENEYYSANIVKLIKQILTNNVDLNINIIFTNKNVNYTFDNSNKTLRMIINYEHTLVKKGGRDTNNSIDGKIMDDNGNFYLVRIDRFDELNAADIIIDYSIPNIHNVNSSNLFNEFSKKHIYIYSSLYDKYHVKENRNIQSLTTFINTNEPRRKLLLENIQNDKRIEHININNCFNKNDLQNLYKKTKLMINIHQTDHHHTFEELRVLPALQCGVIVISEISPLNELIPYNEYIIWSTYDNIIEKANEVLNNYDYYHDLIFNNNNKNLDEFNNINYDTLCERIKFF